MGAIAVITRREEPGRRDDFIALFKETKEVVESLAVNLRSIRLFRNTIAGADTWAYQALFEYDDLASWAATVEREQQDSRYNELARLLPLRARRLRRAGDQGHRPRAAGEGGHDRERGGDRGRLAEGPHLARGDAAPAGR